MSQDIEVFFPVGVAVGVVCTDAPAWEVFYCCLAEAVSEFVGPSLSFAGIDTPASGVGPFCAVTGGVYVDGDEDDVGMPGRVWV